jgi:hypothetical protein
LPDLGDEAYGVGKDLATIALRRGRFTFYLGIEADVEADEDAKSLSRSQRLERESSERKKWSGEFAKHVAHVDLP